MSGSDVWLGCLARMSGSDVWADTAYRSTANAAWLTRHGKLGRIHRKKPRGRPMSQQTRKANATQSKLRARVEHPFAHQKRPMGPVIRTIGIARANPTITLANIAYTMKRWQWLDSQPAPA